MTTELDRYQELLTDRVQELKADGDPVAYAQTVADRIEQQNPTLRAFRPDGWDREQLVAASTARAKTDQGPLYGIPVGIKDIIHTRRFETRAGSALPPELFADDEATAVQRLRTAGGVVAGKTVTTEFAGFAPGLTRNPHDLGHTPGGSSSGSAAAVAAGLVPLAIGTQTGGSVLRPAAFCGIVGVKPTVDRIPTDGIVTRSWTMDTVGVFTQELAGAERAVRVLADEWAPVKELPPPRIGVPTGPYLAAVSQAGMTAFEQQLQQLQTAGIDIERLEAFSDYRQLDRDHQQLHTGELSRVHADWFPAYESFYRTTTARALREGQTISTARLQEARNRIVTTRQAVEKRMDAHEVDCWVTPTAPGPAPEGRHATGQSVLNRPWTYLGLPAITLPAGTVDGLPVGIQCVGRYGSDERLFRFAGQLADRL